MPIIIVKWIKICKNLLFKMALFTHSNKNNTEFLLKN
jgi:hypothetical protein